MTIDTNDWITAVLAVRRAKRLVVFSGAGISAESGIPTFRDAEGFWQRFPPERFATWSGLLQTAVTRPRAVAEFVLNVVEPIALADANPAHLAVAQLEAHAATTVVTQNIDGLHQSAGSTRVLEIHGSLMNVVDVRTGQRVRELRRAELSALANALRTYVAKEQSLFALLRSLRRLYPLDLRGRHRPGLVLFGDAMAEPAWSEARRAVAACDVMLAVGTSGAVYPAAELPDQAEAAGATVISIDPHPCFGIGLPGAAGAVLPRLVNDAFGGESLG